jgi:hypothetical protein
MSVAIVHRYWHPGHKDHFYSTNAAEIGTTTHGQTGNAGFVSEGESFAVFTHHHHGLTPVYRYHNASVHDHFYTTNAAEIGTTTPGQTGANGYTSEGILGYISPTEFPGSIPVYRYYSASVHDHFYTTNAAEIGTTHHGQTGANGYTSEGVLGYALNSSHGIVPVHRYFHAGHHDHFYTTNGAEIGTTTHGQTGNAGYTSEGIAFYMFSHPTHGLQPVYRYNSAGQHDHFYTTNAAEIGTTTPGQTGANGYTSEGILGYVSPTQFFGSVGILRYYQPAQHNHFYTTNTAEIGTTTPGQAGNHGYVFESVLGFVPLH